MPRLAVCPALRPPTITIQPASRTINEGEATSFALSGSYGNPFLPISFDVVATRLLAAQCTVGLFGTSLQVNCGPDHWSPWPAFIDVVARVNDAGWRESVVATATLHIQPVADPLTLTTTSVLEDSGPSTLTITRNPVDGAEVTSFSVNANFATVINNPACPVMPCRLPMPASGDAAAATSAQRQLSERLRDHMCRSRSSRRRSRPFVQIHQYSTCSRCTTSTTCCRIRR